MFIRKAVQLPVVQFQKENISHNELTELFQLRVVPIKVSIKGRTLLLIQEAEGLKANAI